MNVNRPAATFVEVLVIILICIFFGTFANFFACNAEGVRKHNCRANLKELGKAMAAYREDNGGYFPFSWQRAGEAEPEGIGAPQAAMAATSLGNLYPRYEQNAKMFKCPSTEGWSSFAPNLPLEYRNPNAAASFTGELPAGSNWTLQPFSFTSEGKAHTESLSYGYDPRVTPRAMANSVLMADMDGSWTLNHDTPTQNHDGGQNVLFVDGHVAWTESNFCSDDPNDNIFAEDAWNADTDTYLLNKDAGLGSSFGEYTPLHYPPKANRNVSSVPRPGFPLSRE